MVELYLNPPDKVVVLCVDEKSQIQGLERTQPMLPMGVGYIEGATHDYQRHGTTTLFAALNVPDGAVIFQCKPRHRHQEYASWLSQVERFLLSSVNALSLAALSIPPPTSSKKSTAPSALAMQIHARPCGPLPLTPSLRNSRDFVSEFPGRNTSESCS